MTGGDPFSPRPNGASPGAPGGGPNGSAFDGTAPWTDGPLSAPSALEYTENGSYGTDSYGTGTESWSGEQPHDMPPYGQSSFDSPSGATSVYDSPSGAGSAFDSGATNSPYDSPSGGSPAYDSGATNSPYDTPSGAGSAFDSGATNSPYDSPSGGSPAYDSGATNSPYDSPSGGGSAFDSPSGGGSVYNSPFESSFEARSDSSMGANSPTPPGGQLSYGTSPESPPASGSYGHSYRDQSGTTGGHELPGLQGLPGMRDLPGPPAGQSEADELYGPTGERYFSGGGGGPERDNDFVGGHREPSSERRANLPLIIGGAAVAGLLLIGGGVALSSVLKGDSEPSGKQTAAPTRAAGASSAAPTPTPTVPLNAKLKTRTTDPQPLTLREVFGRGSFTAANVKYVRTAARADRNCAKTVNGTKLAAALKKGGCAQALRATYARRDGKLIGTVGVLNLRTEAAARLAEKAAAAKDAYLQPLAGTGVTKNIGKGAALGTVSVRGHYLIMTWVQRPDGKTIATKYHKTVSGFGQQVVLNSNLSKALYYRGLQGKPYQE